MQAGGGARREGGQLQRGRPGAHLPAAGVRPLPEAPGGRAAHRVHQAEAAGHQPGGVHRGAGARPAGARSHPARSQPLQAHHQVRLRDAVPGLHQRQVGQDRQSMIRGKSLNGLLFIRRFGGGDGELK